MRNPYRLGWREKRLIKNIVWSIERHAVRNVAPEIKNFRRPSKVKDKRQLAKQRHRFAMDVLRLTLWRELFSARHSRVPITDEKELERLQQLFEEYVRVAFYKIPLPYKASAMKDIPRWY